MTWWPDEKDEPATAEPLLWKPLKTWANKPELALKEFSLSWVSSMGRVCPRCHTQAVPSPCERRGLWVPRWLCYELGHLKNKKVICLCFTYKTTTIRNILEDREKLKFFKLLLTQQYWLLAYVHVLWTYFLNN